MKCENGTSENRREFIRKASKTVHECNSHLGNISHPQVIENSSQYLLLQTDIVQKIVIGCPCIYATGVYIGDSMTSGVYSDFFLY